MTGTTSNGLRRGGPEFVALWRQHPQVHT